MASPQQRQMIQVPIGAGGIDDKTAAEYVDPALRALAITNGVFAYEGSVEKRRGCVGLSTTSGTGDTAFAQPLRVAARGQEILAIDGNHLFSYGAQPEGWVPTSRVSPCTVKRSLSFESATGSGAGYIASDLSIAEGSGYRLILMISGGTLQCNLIDLVTGATLFLFRSVDPATNLFNPTAIIIGATAYAFYSDNTGNIWGRTMSLAAGVIPVWSSATAIVSDAGSVAYEATPEAPANTGIVIAYAQLTGGGAPQNAIRYLRLESLPALTITASGLVSVQYVGDSITTICVRYDSTIGQCWFGWEVNAAGTYTQYGRPYTVPAWTAIHATITIVFSLASPSTGVVAMSVDFDTAQSVTPLGLFVAHDVGAESQLSTYSTAGVLNYSQSFPFAFVVARPFRMTCGPTVRTFVLLSLGQEFSYGAAVTETTYLVWDCSAGLVVANAAPLQGSVIAQVGMAVGDGKPFNVTNVGTTTGAVSLMIVTNAPNEMDIANVAYPNSVTYVYVDVLTLDFTGATAWQSAEGDGETFFSGGLAGCYDSKAFAEVGWLTWPSGITFVNSTSGGTIPDATYEYAFCWAQVDDAGLVHRSLPWNATITTAGGGTSSINFTIPSTPYTLHGHTGRPPMLEMYRTDGVGSTLYFVVAYQFAVGVGTVGGFLDDNSKFSTSNPLLYTTGGVLACAPAPPLRCMIRHVDRVWGIDETGMSVWYSQPLNGTDAPYFNPALTLQFTDRERTALVSSDDKLFIFSEDKIWYVEGQGPAINGQGSDLNIAVELWTDVGCADWRSTAATSIGIFFQAPTGGIYLILPSTEVQFIGKDVQSYTSPPNAPPIAVLSATLVPDGTTVRFCLASGVVLLYNYFFARWSTAVFTQPGVGVGAPFGNATASCLAGGVWTAATDQGIVIQEKLPASFSTPICYDTASGGTNSWVPLAVTMPWVKPGGLQGWAQIEFIQGFARALDPCDLQVALAYNYAPIAAETRSFTHAQLLAQNPNMAQWRAGPSAANASPQSVSVTLTDAAPSTGNAPTGQGVLWLGLAFAVVELAEVYEVLTPGVKAG